jgi:HD-like signal output (HDOD) protein
VSGWHASIGKAVLENWGFAGDTADAVGNQDDSERERRRGQDPDLTDLLIAGVMLGRTLKEPAPRKVESKGVAAYAVLGLTDQECAAILRHAEYQLGSLQETLGCS